MGTGDADSDEPQGAEAITLSVAAAAPVSVRLQSSVVAAKTKLTRFRPIVCAWKVEGGLGSEPSTRFQWTPERRHLALTWVLRQRTFPQTLPLDLLTCFVVFVFTARRLPMQPGG